MDEREGVEEARRLGLTVTGTLGVLDRAAERGLIELAAAYRPVTSDEFSYRSGSARPAAGRR